MNVSCAPAAVRAVPATGGMETNTSGRPSSCRYLIRPLHISEFGTHGKQGFDKVSFIHDVRFQVCTGGDGDVSVIAAFRLHHLRFRSAGFRLPGLSLDDRLTR